MAFNIEWQKCGLIDKYETKTKIITRGDLNTPLHHLVKNGKQFNSESDQPDKMLKCFKMRYDGQTWFLC